MKRSSNELANCLAVKGALAEDTSLKEEFKLRPGVVALRNPAGASSELRLAGESLSVFILLEKGSELSVNLEAERLSLELFQEEGSSATLHGLEEGSTLRATLGRGAALEHCTITLREGCAAHIQLLGEGAEATLRRVIAACRAASGTAREELSFNDSITHQARETRSLLQARAALLGKLRFNGLIRIERDASRSKGYERVDALNLGGGSARLAPELEILTNDVQCSHGATCKEISEKELYYLATRGLPPRAAAFEVAKGFLKEPLEGWKMRGEALRAVEAALEAELRAALSEALGEERDEDDKEERCWDEHARAEP